MQMHLVIEAIPIFSMQLFWPVILTDEHCGRSPAKNISGLQTPKSQQQLLLVNEIQKFVKWTVQSILC